MELKLEQLQPEHSDDVVAFLRKTFNAPAGASFLEPAHVRWKFFDPRPDWEGSRSYVFREEGRIVAHACVVPARFSVAGGGTIRSLFPIDWASSPSVPGAGLLLLHELALLADVRIGYGGSAITMAIVKKSHSGKQQRSERRIGEVMRARRTLRPWASMRRAGSWWRGLARAGREAWRNTSRPLAPCGQWAAHPVERFSGPLPVAGGSSMILPVRTPELLNYMMDCPSARFLGFQLKKEGKPRGHLLLSGRNSDVRVGDLVIDSDGSEDWAACYALAASVAREYYPQAASVTAMAAPEALQTALLRAGFTEAGRAPAIVQDRRSLLPGIPVLNMIDNDAAYLY